MIPTRTTVLPPSSQSRAAPNARSAMPGSRGAGGTARAGAAALLAIGWRVRARRAAYGLVLQGGGVGILYLTIFAATKLYA
ncbi:DUF2339 domain-containing protein, partial [Burkholderia cenocepacia]|nr:DUF2339 domain-containing protein [Burkholderia cenocepacia]